MLVDDFERFLKHRSNRLYRNAIQKSMTHTKEDIGDSSGGLQTTLTQFSRAGEEKNRKAYVIVRSQNQEMEKEDERTVTVAGPAGAATRTEDKPDLSSLPISASSERAQTKVEIVLSIVSNIPGNVKRLLDDLQPSFVVIYDPVVHCVRQVLTVCRTLMSFLPLKESCLDRCRSKCTKPIIQDNSFGSTS